jgi:hypothetical protein
VDQTIALRLTDETKRRLDAHVKRLAQQRPGESVRMSDAVRALLVRGLDSVERDAQAAAVEEVRESVADWFELNASHRRALAEGSSKLRRDAKLADYWDALREGVASLPPDNEALRRLAAYHLTDDDWLLGFDDEIESVASRMHEGDAEAFVKALADHVDKVERSKK